MDVRLPDGTIVQGVPDGMTKADLTAKLKANGHDVSWAGSASSIPTEPGANTTPTPDKPIGWQDRIMGAIETPMALGAGAIGGVIAPIAGVFGNLFSGKYGTQEGIKAGEDVARNVQGAFYQPRTQTGQQAVGAVGNALNASGLIGVPIPMLNQLTKAANPVMQAGQINRAAAFDRGSNALADLIAPKQTMVGVGAAETPDALLRIQRAQSLPVPINLTKGQATRTFADQQFERETAKNPEAGTPLQNMFAQQNAQIPQNLDAFVDQTGKASGSLRQTGESVVNALEAKKAVMRGQISAAYTEAKNAGQMVEPIPVQPISDYLEKNKSVTTNAPILKTVKSELQRLDPNGTGSISINDLEELRKTVGNLATPGTPNLHYGIEVRNLIDSLTDGKGGPQYQQARRMNENYMNQFDNRQAVDSLLSVKPGTKDRSVAFEDVFNKSIMNGSLDDVRALRRTLQTGGDMGVQAWKELQGQTLEHIKDQAIGNSARDINGNPVVSAAKLDAVIKNLDADGKLDFLFGKKGAEKLRDVNDIAKDVLTSPPGSVNTSNTASVLAGLADVGLTAFTGGVPMPVATAVTYGMKRYKQAQLAKKVAESVNYSNKLAPTSSNALATP